MICYLCAEIIPQEEPFYNDHDKHVCKPCFSEARRCFVCRFPGRDLQPVPGLGDECEFCRGKLVAEGMDPAPLVPPLRVFLQNYRMNPPPGEDVQWSDWRTLRDMQTDADLAPPEFIDDFLRYAYPVLYRGGSYFLLKRMTRQTFVVYMVAQLAVADISTRYGLPDLSERSPFHTFARGWCHWLAYEAAAKLGFDLERRQLRKWPELGGMGEFERWRRMADLNKPSRLLEFFNSSLGPLARKWL
ncbi:MAG: hypothetical protein OEZ59_05230 [Deltaproteobacteria bacterium]|nr:hypothetical protein [Deltaproteobacteria bacterium]